MAKVSFDWRDFTHVGWVPTTTGHLSFSNIGRSRKKAFCSNPLSRPDCGDDGSFFVLQWRTNGDAKGFFRILGAIRQAFGAKPIVEGDNRRFRDRWFPTHLRTAFVLTGKVGQAPIAFLRNGDSSWEEGRIRHDPRTAVAGEIVVFQNARGTKRRWGSFCLMRRIRTGIILSGLNESIVGSSKKPKDGVLDHHRLNAIIRLGRKRENFRVVRVEFLLFRTGELRMRNVGSNRDEKLLAQAYFFLKDMAHVHHHHKVQDDQHLALMETRKDGAAVHDDKTWRKKVLWALAKTSGQFRREDELFRRRQAAGILAYAEAFQRFLCHHVRNGEDFAPCSEIATYDFAAQRLSIATKNEDESWRRQGRSAMAIAAVAATMSFLVLFVSWAGIAGRRGECDKFDGLGVCDYLGLYPFSMFLGLVVVFALIGYAYNSVFAYKGRINTILLKYAKATLLTIVLSKFFLKAFSGLTVVIALWTIFSRLR